MASEPWLRRCRASSCAGRHRREILETRVYGTNSTRANIAKVVNSPACQQADVLIACGGGKALDTVKTAAIELKKIVFTVPTICSNCSAATAIAVVYNDDGSLEGYSYPNRPCAYLHQPQDYRRSSGRSTSGPAWAMPCPSSPRSNTPRAPVIWSIPPVLAGTRPHLLRAAVYLWRPGS